jgi:anti-anti-sigma factor
MVGPGERPQAPKVAIRSRPMGVGSSEAAGGGDPEPTLSVDSTSERGRDRLVVSGELDAFSAPDLKSVVGAASSAEVALDLSAVTFIDSSGLAMIVESHQRLAAEGRRLVITRRSDIVQRLFDLTGVASRLDLEPSA